MIHTRPRRTKLYRQYVTRAGYRCPAFDLKMIGYAAAWRFEQLEGLERKQRQEKQS